MYTLPESLTIQNAASIQKELIRFLDEPGEAEKTKKEAVFDFIHLKDLDTAGLQLLLAAAKSMLNRGWSLKAVNIPAPIQELLQLTGAGDILSRR